MRFVLRVLAAPVLVVLSSACIIIPIPTGGGGGSSTAPSDGPVVLKNECAKAVFLFVGDKPGPDAPTTPLASKAKTTIARRQDGSATVWLFDETGAIVGSAQLSPDTRKAVVEPSCTTITPR